MINIIGNQKMKKNGLLNYEEITREQQKFNELLELMQEILLENQDEFDFTENITELAIAS